MALSNVARLACGATLLCGAGAVTPATAQADPGLVLAQAEIPIPSDAQLDRMERQGITTPPLYDGAGGGGGSIGTEDRQMDEQAHRIDEKLLGGGICRDC